MKFSMSNKHALTALFLAVALMAAAFAPIRPAYAQDDEDLEVEDVPIGQDENTAGSGDQPPPEQQITPEMQQLQREMMEATFRSLDETCQQELNAAMTEQTEMSEECTAAVRAGQEAFINEYRARMSGQGQANQRARPAQPKEPEGSALGPTIAIFVFVAALIGGIAFYVHYWHTNIKPNLPPPKKEKKKKGMKQM